MSVPANFDRPFEMTPEPFKGIYHEEDFSPWELVDIPLDEDDDLSSWEVVDPTEALAERVRSVEEMIAEYDVLEVENDYRCSVLPTLHCADTNEMRNELVRKAEHNIVISGNYCGGKPFDELLEIIERRMEEVPSLDVVIIAHPKFIKDHEDAKGNSYRNKTLIDKLRRKFPDRFSLVESPDGWFGAKKITNHTKCTVIDYGKYFIQGGSGIKDNFCLTGVDDQTVEQYRREREAASSGSESSRPRSSSGGTDSSSLGSAVAVDTGGAEAPVEEAAGSDGVLDLFIPGNFRDQDFVFSCPDRDLKAGVKMYEQALRLAQKWERYNHSEGSLPPEQWETHSNPTGGLREVASSGQASSQSSTVVERMLRTPLPRDLGTVRTDYSEFERSQRKVEDVAVRLFFTGPEDTMSPYEGAMVRRIYQAKSSILIDHMYFQPTKAVMDALICAASRGVKVAIVTAGITKGCPNGQYFFGPSNRYNYSYLVNSLPEKARENVEVYEYKQKKKGLHKKVMIVDDFVLAGSSNMGYKSLALSGDHEMNFEAESEKFAEQTKRIVFQDMSKSVRVMQPGRISFKNRCTAAFHSAGARLWG